MMKPATEMKSTQEIEIGRLHEELESHRRVAKAAGALMQKQLSQISQLKATIRKYAHCRHGSIDCFCTVDAIVALAIPDWDKDK